MKVLLPMGKHQLRRSSRELTLLKKRMLQLSLQRVGLQQAVRLEGPTAVSTVATHRACLTAKNRGMSGKKSTERVTSAPTLFASTALTSTRTIT